MPAPIIGITNGRSQNTDKDLLINLIEASVLGIFQAGGIPVILPTGLSSDQLETLAAHIQGLVITGGPDIDPARYGGEPHPRGSTPDGDRDEMEIDLVHRAVDQGMPLLGICRGLQIMNVALGGSLYTDLEDQLPTPTRHDHSTDGPLDSTAHPVSVRPESLLEKIVCSPELAVNSFHHQGIKTLAPGLVSDATAPGGLTEAIEVVDHTFCLGVQWHPEWMPASPPMKAIFRALVEASRSKGVRP